MRMKLSSLALLVLLAGIQVRSHAEPELKPGEMEPYPWVEESDTLRVPKAFPEEVKHLFRPEMFAPYDSPRQVEL